MKNTLLPTRNGIFRPDLFLFRFTVAMLLSFALSMCKKPDEELKNTLNQQVNSIATKNYHDQLKREFGKALVQVLSQEQEVRSLIKQEALKRFNQDYEVLYPMVADRPMREGKTFRDLLLAVAGESKLAEIEKELPLLTIMVPELPEKSFSAAIWNVATQVPKVGLRVWSPKGVPILSAGEETFELPNYLTPGFPVVVVKENERVITTQVAGENTFRAPNGRLFQFTDSNFNNLKARQAAARTYVGTGQIDQKVVDAKNLMDPTDGWHRDHIYYGLTPTNTKGPFSYAFKETLTQVRFIGGKQGYIAIAEQSGDPRYKESASTNPNAPTGAAAWTDGSFEFLVNAVVNSKATGLPALYKKFSAFGYDLFDLGYEVTTTPLPGIYAYNVKTVNPRNFYPEDVPLINWDLDNFAPAMVITIKEVDKSETVTTREASSSEFAGNISIDPTDSVLKKLGLKFGASAKKNFSSERTVVTSLESDDLGGDIMNFADRVIIKDEPYRNPFFPTPTVTGRIYTTREYSTGTVSFAVEPVRVQGK